MFEAALPSVETLLVSGGDSRITLDPHTGCNTYGCPPRPQPDWLAFGSSTASPISAAGLAAATCLHERLQHALTHGASAAQAHAAELVRQRNALQQLYAGQDDAVIFAGSGSELHLLAAQLAATNTPLPLRIIGIAAAETGSQVPAALRGLHFGRPDATAGTPLAAARRPEFVDLAVREPDGMPRAMAAVDADFQAQAQSAMAADRQVLLIVADVAKTGILAPSVDCVRSLQQQFGERLQVLVDACQLRLAPGTVRAWLAQGCLVAITGSKFFGGPSFSGALLVPAPLAARWRTTPAPVSLQAYSTQADWPANWQVNTLPAQANFGLLLRWAAALAEIQALHALPAARVRQVLEHCAARVRERLAQDALLEALPVPTLNRQALPGVDAAGWDGCQSIFPFLLRRPDGRYLTPAETTALQRDLLLGGSGLACQFGQPVTCGQRNGQPIAALRLCFSARQIVSAAPSQAALEALSAQALLALEQAGTALGKTA
jgi:hypothetical protein